MAESLYILALLACPVGMGAMMWFMMRGSKQTPAETEPKATDTEVVALRAELDQLQAQVRESGRTAPTAAQRDPQ